MMTLCNHFDIFVTSCSTWDRAKNATKCIKYQKLTNQRARILQRETRMRAKRAALKKKIRRRRKAVCIMHERVENAAARGRASHWRKIDISTPSRETTRGNAGNGAFARESGIGSLARANVVIVAPGVRVTHLTTIAPSH